MDRNRQQQLSGLPPLPKSLSAAANAATQPAAQLTSLLNYAQCSENDELFMGASTSAAARTTNGRRHSSLSSTQESLSDRESLHSRASSSHSSHQHTPTNVERTPGTTSTLDNQIAILRREMYGLRQLDLSLLSQLWALNESIQGFRVFLQEHEALSPPSRSRTPSDTNSLTSEPEDESYSTQPPIVQPMLPPMLPDGSTTSHASTSSASGTSGSSSNASSMGKRISAQPVPPNRLQHPQMTRALQQRMRRAPPPPPPARLRPANKFPEPHPPA